MFVVIAASGIGIAASGWAALRWRARRAAEAPVHEELCRLMLAAAKPALRAPPTVTHGRTVDGAWIIPEGFPHDFVTGWEEVRHYLGTTCGGEGLARRRRRLRRACRAVRRDLDPAQRDRLRTICETYGG